MLDFLSRKKSKRVKAAAEDKADVSKSDSSKAQVHEDKTGNGNHDEHHHHPAKQTNDYLAPDDQASTSSSQRPVTPVLKPDDEEFLQSLLDNDDGPPPPLPPRTYLEDWPSDVEDASAKDGKKDSSTKGDKKGSQAHEEKKQGKKSNRLSLLFSRHKKPDDGLKPEAEGLPVVEVEKEKNDLSRVLDRLNLSAKNNKVVSMSNETSEALQKFTLVFKDLVNGVPTAYDDLTALIEDRDGALAKGFDKLPNSLKKLVTQLPDKVTASLGPEILAAAAESQGIKAAEGGLKATAEKLFMPQNLMEMVTKPGAVVGMLRAIVEALKARWPAFIGVNVLWSVALTLLMLMLWYCHKRGREVRLEREKSEDPIDGSDRIEELPDDPLLPAPRPETTRFAESTETTQSAPVSPLTDLPHPPIGPDASTAVSPPPRS